MATRYGCRVAQPPWNALNQPPGSGQTPTRQTDPRLWMPGEAGALRLPSGRLIRGRGLREAMPAGHSPTFGVYLLGGAPPEFDWETRWIRWPDFRLPADRVYAATVLREVWARAADERVEVACRGGRGRTGTALACVAVLDGVPAAEAVAFVRAGYHPRAVETPWQHRFVRRFTG
jgi:protein-tyrosine phosphatase family protein